MPRLDPNRVRELCAHPVSRALVEVASDRPCHVVGGAIRDVLLRRPWHDLDFLVAGEGDRIARQLAERLRGRLVDLGGEFFASWRIVADGHDYDLWDRGAESLTAELGRRDLTVNSIACSLPDAGLIDPFDGIGDLQSRRLVATREDSFRLDPLRVLRLVRIRAELESFVIDEKTLAAAKQVAPMVRQVARERIREESMRILTTASPSTALVPLVQTDLYPRLWGESLPPSAVDRAAALATALQRSIATLDSPGFVPAPARELVGLALDCLLLHELRDPAGGVRYLSDHGYRTRAWLDRVRIVREWTTLPTSERDRRRFLHRLREDWPSAIIHLATLGALANAGQTGPGLVEAISRLALESGPEIFDPPRLHSGEEVMKLLGLDPGPKLGRALEAVRAAQVEGVVNTREDAERFLRDLSAQGVFEDR